MMTEPELAPFLMKAAEVLEHYPAVKTHDIAGTCFARWADSDGFVIRLTNDNDNWRGVWIESHTTMEQFEFDLTAACDTLTELQKDKT